MDLAVPGDYRMKIEESKKINKYQDLAWELKKLWNPTERWYELKLAHLEQSQKSG